MNLPLDADNTDRPISRLRARVSLSQTDAARVLFASSPMDWAQTGFEELIRSCGHPLEEVLSAPVHYPIANLNIDHYRPLRLGERVTAITYIAEVGRRSVVIQTDVVAEDAGALACRVRRVGVAVAHDGSKAEVEPWLRQMAQGRLPSAHETLFAAKTN